jgi:hypothetical protein
VAAVAAKLAVEVVAEGMTLQRRRSVARRLSLAAALVKSARPLVC